MQMFIEIDFNSDEAIYMQLRNQIILGIATSRFQEGDMLPSVRQLADTIGINMHTVNKAYTVLKQEGYVQALEEVRRDLQVTLAKASCRNISREEVHALIDEIYQDYI